MRSSAMITGIFKEEEAAKLAALLAAGASPVKLEFVRMEVLYRKPLSAWR